MDILLLAPAAMAVLTPLLTKAGEKAAETIGERVAGKVMEKSLWLKVKSLFIKDSEDQKIQKIEAKTVADPNDLSLIETKLTSAVQSDPVFAESLTESLNLSYTNKIIVEQLINSIQNNKEKLIQYYQEKSLASIETEGSYEIMIRRTQRNLEKDEKELITILSNR